MNKYETYIRMNKRVIKENFWGITGWSLPVCLDCAVKALTAIGIADPEHIAYVQNHWGPSVLRSRLELGFYSRQGDGLTYTSTPPQCGH